MTAGLLMATGWWWQHGQRALISPILGGAAPAAPTTPVIAPALATRYTDLTALSLALAAFEVPLANAEIETDAPHLLSAFDRLARLTDAPAEVLLLGVDSSSRPH